MAFIDSVKKKAVEAYDYVAPKARKAGEWAQNRVNDYNETNSGTPMKPRKWKTQGTIFRGGDAYEEKPHYRKSVSVKNPHRKGTIAAFDYQVAADDARARSERREYDAPYSDMFGTSNFGGGFDEEEAPRRRKSRRRPARGDGGSGGGFDMDRVPDSLKGMF